MSTKLMIDRYRAHGPLVHDEIRSPHWHSKKKHGDFYRPLREDWKGLKLTGGNLLGTVYAQSYGNFEEGKASMIALECCPGNVLQRTNIFGSGELRDLVYEVLLAVIEHQGLDVDEADLRLWRESSPFEPYIDEDGVPEDEKVALKRWRDRQVCLTEVHITGNFVVDEDYIPYLIQAIDEHIKSGKCRPFVTSITLQRDGDYRSKNFTLTIYGKLLQIAKKLANARRRGLLSPKQVDRLLEAARNTLRVEARLYWNGLDARDRQVLANWQDGDLDRFFWEIVNEFNLTHAIQPMLSADELMKLQKRDRMIYRLWRAREPIDQYFDSPATVKGYRNRILAATGIDISSARRPERLPKLDLEEVLTPSNLKPTPDWARETGLYFEPEALTNILAGEWVRSVDA